MSHDTDAGALSSSCLTVRVSEEESKSGADEIEGLTDAASGSTAAFALTRREQPLSSQAGIIPAGTFSHYACPAFNPAYASSSSGGVSCLSSWHKNDQSCEGLWKC